jgi:16S rRNA processing protein RimM
MGVALRGDTRSAFPDEHVGGRTVVSTGTPHGGDRTGGKGTIEVVVGRIGKPHGLRGEVTLDVRTDEPERRFAPGASLRAEAPRGSASRLTRLTVARARWHQSTLLVTFTELGDRSAAEAARGLVLHATIPADETPEDPEEFYDHQLIGLAAYDVDGTPLGEVTALVHGGAQDLLTVKALDGRNTLVPFVRALVPEVDVPGGRVVIADRPGLVTPLPEDAE